MLEGGCQLNFPGTMGKGKICVRRRMSMSIAIPENGQFAVFRDRVSYISVGVVEHHD